LIALLRLATPSPCQPGHSESVQPVTGGD